MDADLTPKSPVPAVPWALVSKWGSGLSVATLIVLAGGGAARHPEGLCLGLPSLAIIGLAVAACVAVSVSGVRGLGGLLLPAFFALAASVFLPAGSSFLLFSGPPLFAFALAGAALAAARWGRCPHRSALLPAFIVIYSLVAYEAQTRVGPDGDEPQYLMVAESLVRDHDLALEQDFKEARYTAFFSRPPRAALPDPWPAGRDLFTARGRVARAHPARLRGGGLSRSLVLHGSAGRLFGARDQAPRQRGLRAMSDWPRASPGSWG
jgi:hypothetical protein